jgi:cbb3-type cytochrome oxidase subunit 3
MSAFDGFFIRVSSLYKTGKKKALDASAFLELQDTAED